MKQILFVASALNLLNVAIGENVSVTFLSSEFVNAVNTIDALPDKLAVNVPTQKFARDFTFAVGDLLIDLVSEYYRQARLTSIIVMNEWKSSTATLMEKMRHVPNNNSAYLERYLNDVSKHVQQFLIMQPGNSEDRNQVNFPKLPVQSGPVLTHYENYEPNELFNNLEMLVDRDISSVYHFVQKIFSTGWQRTRLSLTNLQQQFRNQFLECTFLKMWIEQTREIDKLSELLRRHVGPESWNRYEECSERVKFIERTISFEEERCRTKL